MKLAGHTTERDVLIELYETRRKAFHSIPALLTEDDVNKYVTTYEVNYKPPAGIDENIFAAAIHTPPHRVGGGGGGGGGGGAAGGGAAE